MKLLSIPLSHTIKLLVSCLFLITATTAQANDLKGKFIISASNSVAAQAGYDILAKGGSAVDAAIATQMVLTLVEPYGSGLGGSAFIVFYDAEDKSITTFNGREKAPAAVKPDHFLNIDGTRQTFYEAVVGGKSVGVPGLIAMMEMAHQKHGKLPWSELFGPAIKLSENGFKISTRLYSMLHRQKYLRTMPDLRNYFFLPDGQAKPVGYLLKNPELAKTLRLIAENGAKVFYKGSIAKKIVDAVKGSKQNPGLLTLEDMANYTAQEKQPVCSTYRELNVCGMGMPSSGGVTSQQILKLIEPFDIASMGPNSVESIHLIAEASALAFSDRALYMADDDFVPVPVKGLLSESYINARRKLIQIDTTGAPFKAGNPENRQNLPSEDDALEYPSTTHMSIIDSYGNAVSMTSTIEQYFGSRLMAGGFILNNQLTDFSFSPKRNGKLVNNRVQPNKRPRSSMTPTIITNKEHNLWMLIGSPGGSKIIGYVTKAIIGAVDWKLPIQEAIELPNFIHVNWNRTLYIDPKLRKHIPFLAKRGHLAEVRKLPDGLHGIRVTKDGYEGGYANKCCGEGAVLQN